jgi:3-deoxy-7-phosphoheptulonate synthase
MTHREGWYAVVMVEKARLPGHEGDDDEDETEVSTLLQRYSDLSVPTIRHPYLIVLIGENVGEAFPLTDVENTIGRTGRAAIRVEDTGISRQHATVSREGDEFVVRDLGSANGTYVNNRKLEGPHALREGDTLRFGGRTALRFHLATSDELDYYKSLHEASSETSRRMFTLKEAWTPDNWKTRTAAQQVAYHDQEELDDVIRRLRGLPPLVTSWEIEDLKSLIADAQEGRRFLLQGGDCAETLVDCAPDIITNKLKILLQMSLVLTHGARRPVIRVGRFAGQYAKPRSSFVEKRGDVELPSYFGDLVNRPEFTPEARKPDPQLLLSGYLHAAVTLNFVRALSGRGFADLRRPEYYDLSFFAQANLPSWLREEYQRTCREITEGLNLLQAIGDTPGDELMKASFYTSHEGLNLLYEAAQTRAVPRREGFYDLTTHLPWVGERTRAIDGAHIEFFRGVANPVGVKLGPSSTPDDALSLCRILNPDNAPGKMVLITRMGLTKIAETLPRLIETVQRAKKRVLWVCDPMHGNTRLSKSGIKTRSFDDIVREVEMSMDIHREAGSYMGGVHFELTGEDVTECVGGGVSEEDLDRRYVTACDPRLNYRQALEMAFTIAAKLSSIATPAPSIIPPPSLRRP